MIGDVIGIAADPRNTDQESHQDEKRDNAEFITFHAFADRQRKQLSGKINVFAYQPNADERNQREGNTDMHTDINKEKNEQDRYDAYPGGADIRKIRYPP